MRDCEAVVLAVDHWTSLIFVFVITQNVVTVFLSADLKDVQGVLQVGNAKAVELLLRSLKWFRFMGLEVEGFALIVDCIVVFLSKSKFPSV